MRLVDANEAKKALTGWADNATDEEIEYTIDKLPTIDAVPVVHARWEKSLRVPGHYVCTHCGYDYAAVRTNYCPYCGARMDDKEEA